MDDEHTLSSVDEQQSEAEERLNRLAIRTAYKVGEDFFSEVVTSLAEILGVSSVIISEGVNQPTTRVRSLALYSGSQLCNNIEYDIEGTPCEIVLNEGIFFHARGVQKAFPRDQDLAWLEAESYGGVSLTDSQGNVIGILCYLNDQEIPNSKWQMPSLKLIQARCGAEVERFRKEKIRALDQHAIEESKRLASLGTLAAGIAHEINNPLTSIQLLVELAMHESQIEKLVPKSNLELIMQSVDSISQIVDSVLRVSNNQDTQKSTCDLKAIIRRACDCTSRISQEANVQVAFNDSGVCMVLGNPLELQQVFVNLISNAIQATKSAGLVEPIEISVVQESGNHCVSVKNRGQKISPDELSRIFDPFYTSRLSEGGTGLGLSVSRGILKAHEGKISARSDSEITEFLVRIPCIRAESRN